MWIFYHFRNFFECLWPQKFFVSKSVYWWWCNRNITIAFWGIWLAIINSYCTGQHTFFNFRFLGHRAHFCHKVDYCHFRFGFGYCSFSRDNARQIIGGCFRRVFPRCRYRTSCTWWRCFRLAIFLSRKLGTTIGDIIILINILVFIAAAYFLSVKTAL